MGNSISRHSDSQQPNKAPQSSTQFTIWAIAASILSAIGVPGAIIGILQGFFLQHPFLIIPLVIFGIVVGLFVYVMILLVQQLQRDPQKPLDDMLVKPVLNWSIVRLYGLFYRPLSRYRKVIYYKYEVLNMGWLIKNLEISLDFLATFVQPAIIQNVHSEHISPSPLATGKDNGQTIEHFLTKTEFAGKHFVFLSSPGSGKSALLQYITLSLVKAGHKASNAAVLSQKKKTIPILLNLADFISEDGHHFTIANTSLADALCIDMKKAGSKFKPIVQWMDEQLRHGNCLVMLDGLDNVVDNELRQQVLDWVKSQMNLYSANRFILTLRPQNHSKSLGLDRIVSLEILPFKKEQIIEFVGKIFDSSTESLKERSSPQACLKRLQENEEIWELVHNPLLLAMSVSLHILKGSELPKRRAALYKQICDKLLDGPQNRPGVRLPYSKEQLERVLRLLAYTLMQQEQTNYIDSQDEDKYEDIQELIKEIDPKMTLKEFLELIFNATGLLEQQVPGRYSLFHSTVKEYLTAVYFQETKDDQALIDNLDLLEWKEIILLYCAQSDASRIIDACLQKNKLELAFACEKEANRIEDEHVIDALNERRASITSETNDECRKIIATSRLERLLERMISLGKNSYITTEYITCAEYQLFLDQHYEQKHFYQPDHWSTPSVPHSQSTSAVLGVRSSDVLAFCQSLTDADRDGWRYRPPTTEEYILIKDKVLEPFTGCFDEQGRFHWISPIDFDLSDLKQQVTNLLQQDQLFVSSGQIPTILAPSLQRAQILNDLLIQKNISSFKTTWTRKMENAFKRVQERALDFTRFENPNEFGSVPNYIHIDGNEFVQVQQLIQALEQPVAAILNREYNTAALSATQEERATLRWSIRYFARTIACILLCWYEQSSSAGLSRTRQSNQREQRAREAYRRRLDHCLDHYLDQVMAFALLELRITQKIRPWEGILLVKESHIPAQLENDVLKVRL